MIEMIGDRVLIKRSESIDRTKRGIILPSTARERACEGIVVSTGDGKVSDNGYVVPCPVHAGDYVLFSKWAGFEIEYKGSTLTIMSGGDIIAILPSSGFTDKPSDDTDELKP